MDEKEMHQDGAEITDAMIEAGVLAYSESRDDPFTPASETVADIYRAMINARSEGINFKYQAR